MPLKHSRHDGDVEEVAHEQVGDETSSHVLEGESEDGNPNDGWFLWQAQEAAIERVVVHEGVIDPGTQF